MKTELKVKYLQHLNEKRREGGFTLIELLVVVIIIGILAAVALPSLLSQASKAKQVEARNNIGALNRAQQSFQLENSGEFSSDIAGLGLGIKDSGNYSYTITGGGDGSSQAINVATINGSTQGLKGYKGIVWNEGSGTEALTVAALCESSEVNADPADPTASTTNACGSDKNLGE